jgi:hypothetical protein
MLFVGLAVLPVIEVRGSKTGSLLTVLPLPASCFCGITVAGNAVIFGTGRPGQSAPDGIYAYTPLGVAPTN